MANGGGIITEEINAGNYCIKPLPEAISVPNGFWVFEDGPLQRQV